MPLPLSIIVPVYKVEPYLHKCVDSLLAQDYSDYEIILVDDGSPDGCPEICDNYAERYANIRVIHQQNGGLSVARNAGIAVAQGEYICFVDSDDFWQPNVLGALMAQIAREKLDVLRFGYRRVDEAGSELPLDMLRKPIDYQNEVVSGIEYLNSRMGYDCYAWQFVTRHELTGEFMPGIYFEDDEWMPRMMLKAKRVNSTSLSVYNYLVRSGSITDSTGDISKIRKSAEGKLQGIKTLGFLFKENLDISWLKQQQTVSACEMLVFLTNTSLYSGRSFYLDALKKYEVFPLQKVKLGKHFERNTFLINLFGANVFCIFMHSKYIIKGFIKGIMR